MRYLPHFFLVQKLEALIDEKLKNWRVPVHFQSRLTTVIAQNSTRVVQKEDSSLKLCFFFCVKQTVSRNIELNWPKKVVGEYV